jgi:Uma2 family endonuclease
MRVIMVTHLALPELDTPVKLVLDVGDPLSDKAYQDFCAANPDLNFERTAEGEIIIVPPAGGESSDREADVISQLRMWAKADRRGRAFGSSVQFILPSGAARSPDAAWVSKERLARLTKQQRREFLKLVPEFVVEVRSPTDRLRAAQRKMEQEWMANGVDLGWLIDGDAETIYVYRTAQPMEKKKGLKELAGEGPVKGFVLDLTEIWEGL